MNALQRSCTAAFAAIVLGSGVDATAQTAADPAASPTLYERLGAWEGITRIVEDTVALHEKNPAIGHYFRDVDRHRLIASVTAFFAAGSGGPNQYEGRDMTTAHAHLGLSEADFDAAVADVMKALVGNGVAQREQDEVKGVLLSLKDPVLGTAPAMQ